MNMVFWTDTHIIKMAKYYFEVSRVLSVLLHARNAKLMER